jgi:hypothetical protein
MYPEYGLILQKTCTFQALVKKIVKKIAQKQGFLGYILVLRHQYLRIGSRKGSKTYDFWKAMIVKFHSV